MASGITFWGLRDWGSGTRGSSH